MNYWLSFPVKGNRSETLSKAIYFVSRMRKIRKEIKIEGLVPSFPNEGNKKGDFSESFRIFLRKMREMNKEK